MEFRTLQYRVEQRIATLTPHDPQTANALCESIIKDLTVALAAASKDPAVKIVVIRGSGQAFCAGNDPELPERLLRGNLEEQQARAQRLAGLLRTIHELRKPVIAVVEGPAVASDGAGIVAACDIVLSAHDVRFSLPDVRKGAIAAVALTFVVKRVGEARARHLALTGREISADEARDSGLVNVLVPRSDIEHELQTLLGSLLTNNSGNAMGLCKELLSRIMGMNLAEALDFATNMQAASGMTADSRKWIAASQKGEAPEW